MVMAVMGGAVTLLGANASTASATASPSSNPTLIAVAPESDAVAAATCSGLSWTLVASVTFLEQEDPSLAAQALCNAGAQNSSDTFGALVGLNPNPTFAPTVLVVSEALTDDPALGVGPLGAIAFASAQLGVPYLWGGTGVGGYDCSGLVQAAYRSVDVAIPRVAQDQFDAGPLVPGGSSVEPGDLIFFGASIQTVEHVGIYIGQGLMIDAPHTGAVVRIEAAQRSDVVGVTRPG
jgi:cell wall-associated NlpC family hydrolase